MENEIVSSTSSASNVDYKAADGENFGTHTK